MNTADAQLAVSDLDWLESWFQSRCDGGWEHQQGVRIESIDNPGWWVTIDVKKEKLAGVGPDGEVVLEVVGDPPSAANGNVGSAEWMLCKVRGGVFEGAGDPRKLRHILRCFRRLVSPSESTPS